MPTEPTVKLHIDIYDRVVRERWADQFGVSDEHLRKAVRMVGSRISTVAAYLGRPKP